MTDPSPGTLFVVATPIGNLGDLSHRGLEVLRAVGAIAAEDTRRTHKLLSHYEIPRPPTLFSCHDHNERKVVARIVGLLRAGTDVALCSDAGMPLINDPGYVVLREVRAEGLAVEVVPGPSAVLTALVASGLPVSSFTFKGYVPRKDGQRRRFFEDEAESPHTLICFEVAGRLAKVLTIAHEVLGPRGGAICVDLTKRFEQVERGTLDELAQRAEGMDERGEVTLVIEGRVREPRRARNKYKQDEPE